MLGEFAPALDVSTSWESMNPLHRGVLLQTVVRARLFVRSARIQGRIYPVLQLKVPLSSDLVCVGIDVAKAKFDVQIDRAAKPFTLENTPAGRGKLIRRLAGLSLGFIAVESSGGYERSLLFDLLDAGLPVAHVNPRVVRDYARGFNQQAKSDGIDARVLACYARERQPRLMSADDRLRHMLQDLNRCRRQLLDQITALKNQAEMAIHPTARKVLQASVEALEEQLEVIDRDVQAEIDKLPEMKRRQELLQKVVGVGPIVSRTLVIELPELGRIDRRRLAALVGVAPMDDDSGEQHGRRMIKGGRPHVRSALYMAALTGIRSNAVLKPYYERLTGVGKAPKVALVACMRKLLIHLNGVLMEECKPEQPETEAAEKEPEGRGEKE
jgi:transposase